PDGQRAVTAAGDGVTKLWDGLTGVSIGEPMRQLGYVRSAHFDFAAQKIVTASIDRTVRIWSAATGLPLYEPLHLAGDGKDSYFSPDGKSVVISDSSGAAWI